VSTNTVAFNERAGLVVDQSVTGVRISGNSAFSNGQLGIDLLGPGGSAGVTPNDPLDADVGANGLQNYPVLTSATLVGPTTHIVGTLDSEPLSDYTLEFFASSACDGSGFGEGELFLGSTYVVTDAAGNAAFEESLPVLAPNGWVATSTATREPVGRTSEFSTCTPITRGLGTSFCDMNDGSLASCPCSNPGDPDLGCDNAQSTGGVSFSVLAQTTSPNGATLQGSGFSTAGTPTAIVIRSNGLDSSSPVVFGDGLRCIDASSLVRLAPTLATGGTSTHSFGHSGGTGPGTFYYQIWYRNTPASYCTPAAFNLSSGRTLVW
jgi:hypothetical protein